MCACSTLLLKAFHRNRHTSVQLSPQHGKDWAEDSPESSKDCSASQPPKPPAAGLDWDTPNSKEPDLDAELDSQSNSDPDPGAAATNGKQPASQRVSIKAFTPGQTAAAATPDTHTVVAATRLAVLKALGGSGAPQKPPEMQTDALGWPIMGGTLSTPGGTLSNPQGLAAPKLPLHLQQFTRIPVLVTGHGFSPGRLPGIEVRLCVQHA